MGYLSVLILFFVLEYRTNETSLVLLIILILNQTKTLPHYHFWIYTMDSSDVGMDFLIMFSGILLELINHLL